MDFHNLEIAINANLKREFLEWAGQRGPGGGRAVCARRVAICGMPGFKIFRRLAVIHGLCDLCDRRALAGGHIGVGENVLSQQLGRDSNNVRHLGQID